MHKLLGDFVVIKPIFSFEGGYDFAATLQVINPANDQTVFEVKNKAFNFAGLDQPLFYPMLNSLIKWMKENDTQYNGMH